MSTRPGDKIVRPPRRVARAMLKAGGLSARIMDFEAEQHTLRSRLLRYGGTLVLLAGVTATLTPLREALGLLNMALVYLVAVIGLTVYGGRWTGVLASVLGFLLFNFFLVPPYYTFLVNDLHNILALFVFLGVSLLLSYLIAGAREQARQAQLRAEDVSRLYELSQAIIGAQRMEDVLPAIAAKVNAVFGTENCWVLLPDERRQLTVSAKAPAEGRALTRDEHALAEWAFRHSTSVEQGTSTTARASSTRVGEQINRLAAFVPLRAGRSTIGALGLADKANGRPLTEAERTVLATFADQAAVALERLALLREAQRAEMLARTDELKSALMSAVSHDLRTPLASIMASVTSLLEPGIEWDDETKQEFLQGIYDEARRLNRLVGNLLDMSRIEGGALRPEMDWYSIAEVIQSVLGRLEGRLADHPAAVRVEEGLPLALFDFTEIDQVLTNLLENAAKYTPPGTPVDVEAHRTGGYIEVSVTDAGRGVASEHLPYLFDKFYQADKRRRGGGTGLGLAISKGLVEAHGGRIRATNRPGGGLSISFTLPVSESRPAQQLPPVDNDIAAGVS